MSQSSKLPYILPAPPGKRNVPSNNNQKRQKADVACNNCRRRRRKCDTQRPACKACRLASLDCEYQDPDSILTRQAAREKIGDYEKSIQNYENVIGILRHGSDADTAAALQRIRETEDIGDAVAGISDAQLLLYGAGSSLSQTRERAYPGGRVAASDTLWSSERLLKSPADDPGYVFSTGYSHVKDVFVEKDVFVRMPGVQFDLPRWTSVNLSKTLLNHLLSLFWTWDHTVERIMYRPVFEDDLASMDPLLDNPMRRRFCSPFLVNALLALSCLYSLESETYTIPDDPTTRGRQFAMEAEIALQKEIDKPSITLYQGLFTMFCYEGNLGVGQKSLEYFSRAIEVYKTMNDPSMLQPQNGTIDKARIQLERQAISWSMWGFYTTEWRVSQAMGFRKLLRKPAVEKAWLEANFPISKPDCSSHWWFPYPISFQAQLSMKVECREAEVVLAEIVEAVLDFLVPNDGSLPALGKPERAHELYGAILNWKYSLPGRLRLEEAVLPATILLHVYAELMLTAVLRPFGHMSKEEFGKFDPRERCYSHANRMMTAIWTYRAFAILRTEYWLVHPITTSALIVLQDLEIGSAEVDTLIRAGQCLYEMTRTLPLAADCLSSINGAFIRSKLQIPAYVQRYLRQGRRVKDGLMHHAIAALMPSRDYGNSQTIDESRWNPSHQELLNELDEMGVD